MQPQPSTARSLEIAPNGGISSPRWFQGPVFLSFCLRMRRLPSNKTISKSNQAPTYYIWCENQKSFVGFCPSMDSRYRYSVASCHRWDKSSAAELNDMPPFQPLEAIRPNSKGHQSAPYIPCRHISKITTDWTLAC